MLYASTLSGVFPAVSAAFNSSSTFANASFCGSVALSTNAAFAALSSAVFCLTFATANSTSSTVEASLSITLLASFITSCASAFTLLYSVIEFSTLPSVETVVIKLSSSPLAAVNAVLSTVNSFCFCKTAVNAVL